MFQDVFDFLGANVFGPARDVLVERERTKQQQQSAKLATSRILRAVKIGALVAVGLVVLLLVVRSQRAA